MLHQSKLASHKEFVLLESDDCDGLQPGENGGFPCRMHAVHIDICAYAEGMGLSHVITVNQMSHGAELPCSTSRWLLWQVIMHL